MCDIIFVPNKRTKYCSEQAKKLQMYVNQLSAISKFANYNSHNNTHSSNQIHYCVYLSTLMTGHQRLNSLHQFASVLLGTITRCGPLMFLYSCRYATIEILCRVLPVVCGCTRKQMCGVLVL